MPTYAYACKDCSHAFDIVQKFSEDSLTVCPECQGTLRKKFGSVGVSFKGSGFYRTDSRGSDSAKSAAKTPSSSSDKGAGTSGGSAAEKSASSSTSSSSSSSSTPSPSTSSSSTAAR